MSEIEVFLETNYNRNAFILKLVYLERLLKNELLRKKCIAYIKCFNNYYHEMHNLFDKTESLEKNTATALKIKTSLKKIYELLEKSATQFIATILWYESAIVYCQIHTIIKEYIIYQFLELLEIEKRYVEIINLNFGFEEKITSYNVKSQIFSLEEYKEKLPEKWFSILLFSFENPDFKSIFKSAVFQLKGKFLKYNKNLNNLEQKNNKTKIDDINKNFKKFSQFTRNKLKNMWKKSFKKNEGLFTIKYKILFELKRLEFILEYISNLYFYIEKNHFSKLILKNIIIYQIKKIIWLFNEIIKEACDSIPFYEQKTIFFKKNINLFEINKEKMKVWQNRFLDILDNNFIVPQAIDSVTRETVYFNTSLIGEEADFIFSDNEIECDIIEEVSHTPVWSLNKNQVLIVEVPNFSENSETNISNFSQKEYFIKDSVFTKKNYDSDCDSSATEEYSIDVDYLEEETISEMTAETSNWQSVAENVTEMPKLHNNNEVIDVDYPEAETISEMTAETSNWQSVAENVTQLPRLDNKHTEIIYVYYPKEGKILEMMAEVSNWQNLTENAVQMTEINNNIEVIDVDYPEEETISERTTEVSNWQSVAENVTRLPEAETTRLIAPNEISIEDAMKEINKLEDFSSNSTYVPTENNTEESEKNDDFNSIIDEILEAEDLITLENSLVVNNCFLY